MARAAVPPSKVTPPKLNRQLVDGHKQIYGMSCIPMSIEMVLKLIGRAPTNYYELQTEWKNKSTGSFKQFDGQTIKGVTFKHQFNLKRTETFPLTELFATIEQELNAGRYVIISLTSGQGSWHMYVVHAKDATGDFVAVSKIGTKTVEARHIKSTVTKMKGTDILTYTVNANHQL